jgi:hypothetical protein
MCILVVKNTGYDIDYVKRMPFFRCKDQRNEKEYFPENESMSNLFTYLFRICTREAGGWRRNENYCYV